MVVCAAVELVMLYGDHLFYVFILRNNSDPAMICFKLLF